MKSLIRFTTAILFFSGLVFSAHAGFSSIYVWGDSLSTTTNNYSPPDPQYYGMRASNGRTWVEVLAQRQGLGANSITNANWDYSSNNLSYYYHLSSDVVADVNKFTPPANATNCLFVLWVDNADFVADMLDAHVGDPANAPNHGTNLTAWTTAINQHLANHFNIITNLYAKGCRMLIAPNAANIMSIPQFDAGESNHLAFVRQQVISFNTNYAAMLDDISANSPGLTIYNPNIFSLLDNVLTNAAVYGLTNALDFYGNSIDALDALNPRGMNGPGTNYIFWDYTSPTAQFSEIIADFVQQLISPVQISGIIQANGNSQLNVVNVPVGLNGFVDGSTNLAQASWTPVTDFSSLTTQQPILFVAPPISYILGGYGGTGSIDPNHPATNSVSVSPVYYEAQFYRLRFPCAWNWP